MELNQEETKKRKELVDYGSRIVESEGLPVTDEMREMDRLYIAGQIDFEELGRRARQP
jgi:hypothetical protein